jgi:hypothetical protein
MTGFDFFSSPLGSLVRKKSVAWINVTMNPKTSGLWFANAEQRWHMFPSSAIV